MALIKCPDCGAEISAKAKACPEYGAVREKPKSESKIRGWITFIIAVSAFVMGVINFFDARENARITKTINANRLLDKAWNIIGKKEGTISIRAASAKDKWEREKAWRKIDKKFKH